MTKFMKFLHLLGLVLFLGSIFGFIIISDLIDRSMNVRDFYFGRKMIYVMMNVLTMSGMGLLIISGIIMSIKQGYGFFKVRWLAIKQVLAVVILLNALFILSPAVKKLFVFGEASLSEGNIVSQAHKQVLIENIFGTINFIALLIAMFLAIFKFWTKKET